MSIADTVEFIKRMERMDKAIRHYKRLAAKCPTVGWNSLPTGIVGVVGDKVVYVCR